jgi:hypothetical protein
MVEARLALLSSLSGGREATSAYEGALQMPSFNIFSLSSAKMSSTAVIKLRHLRRSENWLQPEANKLLLLHQVGVVVAVISGSAVVSFGSFLPPRQSVQFVRLSL